VIDRFDEAGIVFWSETIGPSVSVGNTLDPVWMKFQMQQLEEMLDNALNHASVMTWGWYVIPTFVNLCHFLHRPVRTGEK
jgi:hypothetical protein